MSADAIATEETTEQGADPATPINRGLIWTAMDVDGIAQDQIGDIGVHGFDSWVCR